MSWLRPCQKSCTSARLSVERLEDRTVPYSLSGYKWGNVNVSASFVPDGTVVVGGYMSNLNAIYDAKYPTAMWQREFARAVQTWASVTPLNFRFVADGGQAQGVSGLVQGDSRFGDIRFGAKPMGTSLAYTYYPVSSSTIGGDSNLNSNYSLNIGSQYDLYSLVLHETGHSLGLGHSSATQSVMQSSLRTIYTGLYADDIVGIRAIYGARQADAYDARWRNDALASATPLSLDATGTVALAADLTDMADTDCYQFTVPAGLGGSWTVSVDARGLSLLSPAVSVYDAAGTLVASASAGSAYGTLASVTLTGLFAGQTYKVVADGATADVFGMGAYRLTIQPAGTSTFNTSTSSSSGTTTTTTTTGSGAALMPASGGLEFVYARQWLSPEGGDGTPRDGGSWANGHEPALFLAPTDRPPEHVPELPPGLTLRAANPTLSLTPSPDDGDHFFGGVWIDPDLLPVWR
ncbi:MAG: matrixin family metalloprotease [Gemmata sp.]